MSNEWVFNLYIFVLATFVGYQLISRVPPLLHTPLMSGTNAISGISLVASLIAAGSNHRLSHVLGFIAVTCATTNVVAPDVALGFFGVSTMNVGSSQRISSMHAPTASQVRSRVPRFSPYFGHSGATGTRYRGVGCDQLSANPSE